MSFYCLTHFLFEMLADAAAEFPAEIILLTLLQKSVKIFSVLDTSKATSISLFSLFCLSSTIVKWKDSLLFCPINI